MFLLLPFWSSADHRLRAGWRLILQIIFFFVITLIGIGALDLVTVANPATSSDTTLIDPVRPVQTLGLMAVTVVGMVFSTWLMSRFVDKRPFANYGFHIDSQWWQDFGFGLVLGVVLMGIIFLVEWILGWVTIDGFFVNTIDGQSFFTGFVVLMLHFIGVGFYEELLSRGYQLLNLAEGLSFLGPRAAIVLAWLLSSAVFGVLHAGNPNATPISTFNLVIAGIYLGLPFVLTRSLALPIGLHITWNFAQGNIFGFPVSGLSVADVTVIQITQNGPDLWTGGAFGPEAGLLGLLAIVIGSTAIIAWVRYHYGEATLQDEIAIYQKPAADATDDQQTNADS